jgi:hypothetical protein
MSWTKSEKILILLVVGILFLIVNVASYFIIKNILNVSIYEAEYYLEQKRFVKSLGSKVHPFYGFTEANQVGFDSDVSVERNFISISPSKLNNSQTIKVLVLGGSVASHLSLSRLNIQPFLLASKLNDNYNTNKFVVYNAAFGGGKQPQQFFKLIYLDLLGFKPDIIINYDGFNEIALPFAENLPKELNAIYPRNFDELVASSLYDGQCFEVNNFLLSINSYVPLLELSKWIYVRSCHNAATGQDSNSSGWNPVFSQEKQEYLNRTLKVWELSSNKIYDFAVQNEIPYLHFVQPNQYLAGSKILSELEKTKFLSYEPYKTPIEYYYKYLEINNLKTPNKYDHRYLFIDENKTVYSDKCCHFNLIGMKKITNSIIKDASDVFEELLRKKK